MKTTLLHFAEKLKKSLHIVMASAMIICTTFSFAFADGTFTSFLSKFYTSTPSYSGLDEGYYAQFSDSYDSYRVYASNYDSSDTTNYTVYPFFYYDSSLDRYYINIASTGNVIMRVKYSSDSNAGNSNTNFNSTYNLYSTSGSTILYVRSITTDNIPIYTSVSDALAAISDYIENGGNEDIVYVNKPLTIPQGYAAVIVTTNMTAGKGTFRLRANTGNLGNSNLWRDIFGNDNVQSGQAVYDTNTAIISYDFDDYPQLTWSPYEYSLLRATAYEYFGEATKSYTYTYIFNPIQGNATSIKNGQNTNSYITLYMNDAFDGQVKLFPLTSMAALGQGQTIDVGNENSNNAGSGDISNGTWTNSDGNVFSPPQGGGNGTGSSQNPLEAIAGTVEHLGEVLNQFVGGLSTILTAPVEAIQTLINNGSAFVSQLSGLYSWLPTQVYSTLTSAIILCITVGVLKVLL